MDGNLTVHSVLVNEKAISSRDEEGMKKKAVALDLVTAIRSGGKQPYSVVGIYFSQNRSVFAYHIRCCLIRAINNKETRMPDIMS
nr:basic-leucine zipper domain-containing protein [Tanacetum cinerariifolium]